jgi:hypothetical protein
MGHILPIIAHSIISFDIVSMWTNIDFFDDKNPEKDRPGRMESKRDIK